MLTQDQAAKPATALRDRFEDAVTIAGDADWDAARQSFNLLVDQSPAAVARPRSAAEAAAIVVAARDSGLRIAPQGSSHNVGPLGSLEETVIVKLERMTGVGVDADAGTARVEAGARWWDVTPKAAEHGYAALHGSSPEINVVGYSVGGGIGWLARKHGLQANRVNAVEIVTADGEVRTVDAENDPELFWGVRGGGGNFGLVTAIEFGLIELRELYAGALFFPFERAAEVLHAYRELTAAGLPDELTSIGRTLQLPDLEVVPEIVRGKSFAIVEAAYLGSEADGADLLRPLRDLGPEMDTFATVPPEALAHLHMDPIDPVPYVSAHAMLGELTERALDEALAAVGPGAGSPVSFEIRHAGGARRASRLAPRRDRDVAWRVHDVRPRADPRPGDGAGDAGRPGTSRRRVPRRRVGALPQLHRGAARHRGHVPGGHRAAAARRQAVIRPRGPLPRQPRGLKIGRARCG